MSTAKQILYRLIDETPAEILPDIIYYIAFIKVAPVVKRKF